MKFRPACSGLAIDEAMERMVEFDSMKELKEYIRLYYLGMYDVDTLKCREYGYDDRVGWNTYLVTADLHEGGKLYKDSALFFVDGDISTLKEE